MWGKLQFARGCSPGPSSRRHRRAWSLLILFLISPLLLAAQQDHVPELFLAYPASLANPSELPSAEPRTSTVHRARAGEYQFNLHSYLAHHNGRFWAIWSASPADEESPAQIVRYATSVDGHAWSEPRTLAPDPDGPTGPARWIARGLYVAEGRLHALAAYIESADYGQRGRGAVWKNLRLMRFEWNNSAWDSKGVFAENCMNNFPPERLGGRLAMVCRDRDMNVSMALADPAAPGAWRRTPIASEPPFDKMDEPSFYAGARPGEVHMIVRDNARSGFLLRAISRDHGLTWSPPVRTNYPDATSKNFPGRLSNGLFYLINNPNPKARDPLAISFSRDGWSFADPLAIRAGPPPRRFAGRAKPAGGTVQYPHAIEHNGSLWVIYSANKEDIEIAELPVARLQQLQKLQKELLNGPLDRMFDRSFDVVVYGGTPGGVAAAIAAARLGHTVGLFEYQPHLGGMMTSGLGKSDIETRAAIGGLFREFTGLVHAHYVEHYGASSRNAELSRQGYYYEPSVAQRVLDGMVAREPRIKVFTNHRLIEAWKPGNRLLGIRVRHRTTGQDTSAAGRVFVDGTYEGDLFAAAGARYRLGRESRAEFGEPHAGVIYQNYETRENLPGSTGEGDRRIPAYTYRLCMTDDPANAFVLASPPPAYDRTRYLGYLDDWRAGRLGPPKVMKDGVGYHGPTFNTVVRALSFAELPNRKFDVNMNPRPLGFPFAEENYEWPEASWEDRERVAARLRNLTLGLIYFLQNDPEVPPAHRELARRYHLARDEFAGADPSHFPWQLYVREARRLAGLYTLTEHDTMLGPGSGRTAIHSDSIAAGEFPIDSFPVRKHESSRGASLAANTGLEGYIFMLDEQTKPYQIPYRVMIPEQVDGLLVPVAASTTHIAFSTVRLEPTWMALGQAAGVAAHLAMQANTDPRQVNIATLQRELLKAGQVITFFKDIDRADPAYAALQYFGTKGFFDGYFARSRDPLDPATAARWWRIAKGVEPPPDWQAPTLTRGEFCLRLWADK